LILPAIFTCFVIFSTQIKHDVKLLSHDLGYLFPHFFFFPGSFSVFSQRWW